MEQIINDRSFNALRFIQLIIRVITSISIFAITVFFTPNFKISSFPILIISSIVITLLDYLMSIITGIHDIPIGRGFVGFISATIIIYTTQYFVDGYYISIFSSLIAAGIYGIIDYFLPNK